MDALTLDDQFQLVQDDTSGSEMSEQSGSEEDEVFEDESYYFADVVFLVEDRLFKVPRRYFEEDSEIFRDMFRLPVPKNVVPEGRSKEKPLHLVGIGKNDFKQLLKVMYPRNFGQEESLTVPEWTSVLKLATMWEFGEIRKLAIRKMSQLTIDTVEKIVMARDYHVVEWLVPAINSIARRDEPMTLQDVNRLGWDYVLKIAQVRESFTMGKNVGYCRYCDNYIHGGGPRGEHDFAAIIQRVFEKELEANI